LVVDWMNADNVSLQMIVSKRRGLSVEILIKKLDEINNMHLENR